MGEAVIPDGVLQLIKDLTNRVRILESASRLQTSSLRDGTLYLQDQNGANIVVLGKQGDGSHGVAMFAPAGFPIWEFVESKGLVYPASSVPMRQISAVDNVTSASFFGMSTGRSDTYTASAFYSHFGYSVPAGTTGEVFFKDAVGATSTLTLGGPSSGFIEVAWLHGATIGAGPAIPEVQARRTGGAGTVNIYVPDFVHIIDGDRVGATSSPGIAFI